jgi:hypothetical protein
MIVKESILALWLLTAKEGEQLHYARATALKPNAVTRRLMTLAESGHVELKRKRRAHDGDENFLYIAQRLALPLPGQSEPGILKAKGSRREKPQDKRFGAASAVAREIAPQVRALIAERGMVPSAGAIARSLGIYGEGPVRLVLERLAA